MPDEAKACLTDLEDRESVFVALEKAEPCITVPAHRALLWAALRQQLHRHRRFADADWSLPKTDCDRLEKLYDRFAPTDALERVAWLFEEVVQMPNPSQEGYEAEQRDVDHARQRAAFDVFARCGVGGIMGLSRQVSVGGYLGKALYESGIDDLEAMLEALVRSDDGKERDVAHGLIISLFRDRKEAWGEVLISRARAEGWGDTALMAILDALPNNRWTWDRVAALGPDVESEYWRRVKIWWADDSEDAAVAIEKLISVGRARHALSLVGRTRNARIPSSLLVQVLHEAMRQPFDDAVASAASSERTMFRHYVVEVLKQLDARDDVDVRGPAALEWGCLLPVRI